MAILRLPCVAASIPPYRPSCTLLRRGPTPGIVFRRPHESPACAAGAMERAAGTVPQSCSGLRAAGRLANRLKYVNMADLTAPAVADLKPASADTVVREA